MQLERRIGDGPASMNDLERRLGDAVEAHGVPGASAAVLIGDAVHLAATGLANRQTAAPATPDTPFQIGSATKAMTASLVMQSVERGQIELDAPVRHYLPEFRLAGPSTAITVRHLLTHTSGIKGDFFIDLGDGPDALARYVEALRDVPTLYEPGRFYSYCNAGYPVLGRICEVTGQGMWDDLLKSRLFDPLGMTRSASRPADRAALGTAIGYDRAPDGTWKPGVLSSRSTGPSGSTVASTAGDLLRFARMHLDHGKGRDGTSVLSTKTVLEMRIPQVRVPGDSFAGSWGLGWMLMNWDGVAQYGHDGATAGSLSLLRVFPARRIAIALLCNAGDGANFMRSMAGALFQDLVQVNFPKPPTPSERSFDLRQYAGRYERYFAAVEVEPEGNELICRAFNLTQSGEQTPREPVQIFRLKPKTAEMFVEPAKAGGRPPLSAVFLEFDASGAPQFLFAGARAMKRVA